MAKLTEEESNLLKRLMAKREAPDAPPVGKAINVSIDLGDEKQVARAIKLGLLDSDEDTDTGGGDDDKDGEGDETPKRKGYFGD